MCTVLCAHTALASPRMALAPASGGLRSLLPYAVFIAPLGLIVGIYLNEWRDAREVGVCVWGRRVSPRARGGRVGGAGGGGRGWGYQGRTMARHELRLLGAFSRCSRTTQRRRSNAHPPPATRPPAQHIDDVVEKRVLQRLGEWQPPQLPPAQRADLLAERRGVLEDLARTTQRQRAAAARQAASAGA